MVDQKEKRTNRIVTVLLTIMFIVLTMPMSTNAKVKLNATKKTIQVGKTLTLNVTGTNKKVKWSSSNKKIASFALKRA